MRTIWKFQLQMLDIQTIKVPEGAELLTVQNQKFVPCIWALVNPSAELVQKMILIVGTGYFISDLYIIKKYIGTVQKGTLVFHFFEVA